MAFSGSAIKRVVTLARQTRCYSAPAERAIPPSKQKYVPTSGTYPKGFLVGTSHAGVKESNTQYNDIALVVSERPCTAEAVFTRNIFQAAPVQASKRILHERRKAGKLFRGVVVNSGCANAVTGKAGLEDAYDMSSLADQCYHEEHEPPSTLVMSTGVIGKRLPMEKITAAIPRAYADLGSTHDHWLKGANAICTTDTFPKLLSRTFTLPSHPDTTYSIAGMTKGAGMIHPNMGTLLAIICTDAKLDPGTSHRILSNATNESFNSISVDGDTSTNDTVALLANGAAAPADVAPVGSIKREGGRPIETEDGNHFLAVLKAFMKDLSQLVVRDGEGATKFIKIRVRSPSAPLVVKRIAESIATSALVKTAMYGKDANWGRILCAIGYARGVMNDERESTLSHRPVKPQATSVSFIPTDGSLPLKLLVRGEPQEVDEARAKEILEMEDLEILVDLYDSDTPPMKSDGTPRSIVEVPYWTCDFSHEYVTINGDYRT